MASVKSKLRSFVKPLLFKLLGNRFYKYAQMYGKIKDINERLVEEKEMELLPYFVTKDSDTIDVGANYGYFTERLSKLVGDKGKVYAFEPIPFTFSVLELIKKKLRLSNTVLYQKGVSNTNETLEFTVPKVSYGAISGGQSHISSRKNDLPDKYESYTFSDEEKIPCEVVKLDTFLMNDLKNVSFIKIDIEGAELFALQGMQNIIQKYKPVLLIEIVPAFLSGFSIDQKQLIDFIQNMNYSIFLYNENTKLLETPDTIIESNYILIHNSNIANYKTIVKN